MAALKSSRNSFRKCWQKASKMQSEERSLLFFFLGGSKNETTIHRAQQNNRNYRKERLK